MNYVRLELVERFTETVYPCTVCGTVNLRVWWVEVPGGSFVCGNCLRYFEELRMEVRRMRRRQPVMLGPYNRENLLAALARITGDGRCPGCGEILTEADYVRGSCHACGMEVEDE